MCVDTTGWLNVPANVIYGILAVDELLEMLTHEVLPCRRFICMHSNNVVEFFNKCLHKAKGVSMLWKRLRKWHQLSRDLFSLRTWLVAFASLQLKNNFGSTCAGIFEVKIVLTACLCAEATRVDFECFPPRPTLVSIHFRDEAVNDKLVDKSLLILFPQEALSFSVGSDDQMSCAALSNGAFRALP